MKTQSIVAALAVLFVAAAAFAGDGNAVSVSGVVKSVGKDFIVIQGPGLVDRRIAVGSDTKIGLSTAGAVLDANAMVLRYTVSFGSAAIEPNRFIQIVEFPLPKDMWLRGGVRRLAEYQQGLARPPLMLAEYELLRSPIPSHAPEANDLTLAGKLSAGEGGALKLAVGDKTVAVRLRIGTLAAGLGDIRPFVTDVSATGREAGDALAATDVRVTPVGDGLKWRDANLPNVLVIGDSISLGYMPFLRQALLGKANVVHPPINCGSSRRHVESLHRWLGVYTEPGRRWDVITFNCGHWDGWDPNLTKEQYLGNLQYILDTLSKTGAKLVWVTTTPVPYGYNVASAPNEMMQPVLPESEWASIEHEAADANGWVPGRNRMLNSWATELFAKHPEVLVCDQWQIVKNAENGFYRTWWRTKNVHFLGGKPIPLARALAAKVLESLGRPNDQINPMSIHGDWGKDVPEIPETRPTIKL